MSCKYFLLFFLLIYFALVLFLEINSPHSLLSVVYCITIWCKLKTFPRSTRHSAIGLPYADAVHCNQLRSDFCPSTARSAEYFTSSKGWSCHVDFLKARFSEKYTQYVFSEINYAYAWVCMQLHDLLRLVLLFYSFSNIKWFMCLSLTLKIHAYRSIYKILLVRR